MARPEYIEEWEIETVDSPIWLAHAEPEDPAPWNERERHVLTTKTMDRAAHVAMIIDTVKALTYYNLGLADRVVDWLCERVELDWWQAIDALVGSIIHRVPPSFLYGLAIDALNGDGWGRGVPRYGAIKWPFEEYVWLLQAQAGPGHWRVQLREALTTVLEEHTRIPWLPAEVDDVVDDQVARIAFPDRGLQDWARETMWYGRRRGAFRKMR